MKASSKTQQTKKVYDDFSSDYDRFVNWPGRLELELPFIENQLGKSNAHRVLDAACGTGMHAIALAKMGFEMAGADLSNKMIQKAASNAKMAAIKVDFNTAGFGDLSCTFGKHKFDALLCLGNSLPHLLSKNELSRAIMDFADCLKPSGILIIQNRNFDAIMKTRQRWMEPQSAKEGNSEWLFLRFYDINPDGSITFNILNLHREESQSWDQTVLSTRLRPILAKDLRDDLTSTGFNSVEFFGDMVGSLFNEDSSSNLIAVAKIYSDRT